MKLKAKFEALRVSVSGRSRLIDSLLEGGYARLFTVSALSGAVHLVYALFNLLMAAIYGSYWFLTMGAYYLTVCGMRASALSARDDKKAIHSAAVLMFLLAVIVSGIVCLSIAEKRNATYGKIPAIAMAAYTFWVLGIAITNLLRARKQPTVQNLLLRYTSLVCALGSLFSLERTLMGTFGAGDYQFMTRMEAASGAALFVFLIYLGIKLTRRAANR